MQLQLTGKLYVIAAPSGAGKTSLVKALVEQDSHLRVAVSHTTRPKRADEIDGSNYHFVSSAQFEQMIAANAFVEHACVFGNCYGTSWHAITSILEEGQDIILEIDWQGAQQIRRVITDCITIFILPPSLAALRTRLENRAQDRPEVILRRTQAAIEEISHHGEFDYLVVNDRFEMALTELREILAGRGERFRTANQVRHLAPLIADLMRG